MRIFYEFLTALTVALVATPVVRLVARRQGLVAKPTGDRWHRRPTALFGGVAVFVATGAAAWLARPIPAAFQALGAAAAMMFGVGLVDDRVRLRPATKLTLQIAAASLAVWGGVRLGWTGSLTLDSVLTIFWFIGVTNAFNFVDNMDGACAGVGAIAAVTVAAVGIVSEGAVSPGAGWAAALCGALLGFLVYNFHPASIFLGDSGSLFVGFLLAGLAGTAQGQREMPFAVVVLPVIVLAVPIFDTTLVTVARKLSGRPASQGGTDHTAHRLVALGFSEVNAVLLLYGLAALSGGCAVALHRAATGWEVYLAGLVLGLGLFGVALLRVRAYGGGDYSVLSRGTLRPLVVDFLFRHHVFELLLDILLVAAAYYTSYRIRFSPERFAVFFPTLLQTLPVVIACQIVGLRLAGVYGFMWRYFGVTELIPLAKGTLLGTAATSVVLVFLYRFHNVSRGVFLIYGMLLLILLIGSRLMFRLLPQGRNGSQGLPALLYGAGDAGEMLVRELAQNVGFGYRVIGLIDDDARKAGRRVHGVRVLGGLAVCQDLLAAGGVQAVIVSSVHFRPARLAAIEESCRRHGVRLLRFRCELEEVAPLAAGQPVPQETEEQQA